MVEYALEDKRGLYGSWQFFTQGASVIVGLLLVTGLTAAVSQDVFVAWVWRVLFLLALPFGLIGLYIRQRLEDTPAFRAVQQHHEVQPAPLKEALRTHGKTLLKVVGITWIATSLNYLFIFMPTYLSTQLRVPLSSALAASMLGIAVNVVVILLAAVASDRMGKRKPFLVATPVLAAITSVPVFGLLQTGDLSAIIRGFVVLGAALGLTSGVYAAAMCEVFPTTVRYSSLSLSYSVAVSIFGGTTPFIFTALLAATGNPLSPAFYLVVSAIVGLIAALTFPETAREPLRER